MIDSIDSDVTQAGEKFQASLDDPLVVNERIVVERGADVTVQVVQDMANVNVVRVVFSQPESLIGEAT